MENHNPNIPPPFGVEKQHPHIPSYSNVSRRHYYYYQDHHYQYYQQYEQYFQPQYQQQHFVPPQLPQSQIVRGSYSTATIDSYNNTVATSTIFSSVDAQNHSYIPSHKFPETFPKDDTTEFWNIVGESIGWKKSDGVGPFYDFVIREGSKRRKGWCRDLADISTSRLDNPQTLQYYDLLLKCNAPFAGSKIMDHFYYAFDMDRCSLNHVMLPQSSILKRKRTSSSQPTTAPTRASARGPNGFLLLQNSSASKRNKNSQPLKIAQTPIQKAPEYISTAILKLDDDLDLARNTSRNTYDNFAFNHQRNANSYNNNNDDDDDDDFDEEEEEIAIGATLTCEQLVKQKFDHAAKNGYIIAIDI